MSYTQCPSCGSKALSVATQCPRCGIPFESRLASYPAAQPRRKSPALVAITVALGGILFAAGSLLNKRPAVSAGFEPPPTPPAAVAESPKTAQPAPAAPGPTDTERPLAAGGALPDSIAEDPGSPAAEEPSSPQVVEAPAEEPSSLDGAIPAAPRVPRISMAFGPTERRYTTIWVNVRQARGPSAPVVKVLRPGEEVEVDSLRHEWYRVVDSGQAVGYVYRGFVDEEPPSN